MKTSVFRHLVATLSRGIFFLPGFCLAQEITDLTITTDPDSQLKSLEITVDVPPLSNVQLQGNPLLAAGGWGNLPGETSLLAGGEATFATPLLGERGFFRFKTETIPFSVALVPAALFGMWVGSRIVSRIDQAMFKRATLIVLLVAGANLVRRALF